MAWYSLQPSDTAYLKPLNQVLFDRIRGDLDFLKAQTDTMAYVQLGGFPGPSDILGTTPINMECFNLQTPPSGKKWALEFRCQAYQVGGDPRLTFRRLDKKGDVADYLNSPSLPASTYGDIAPIILYLTSAAWGLLQLGNTSNSNHIWVRIGVCRAYLVDA